jgi:hypothetical protein
MLPSLAQMIQPVVEEGLPKTGPAYLAYVVTADLSSLANGQSASPA